MAPRKLPGKHEIVYISSDSEDAAPAARKKLRIDPVPDSEEDWPITPESLPEPDEDSELEASSESINASEAEAPPSVWQQGLDASNILDAVKSFAGQEFETDSEDELPVTRPKALFRRKNATPPASPDFEDMHSSCEDESDDELPLTRPKALLRRKNAMPSASSDVDDARSSSDEKRKDDVPLPRLKPVKGLSLPCTSYSSRKGKLPVIGGNEPYLPVNELAKQITRQQAISASPTEEEEAWYAADDEANVRPKRTLTTGAMVYRGKSSSGSFTGLDMGAHVTMSSEPSSDDPIELEQVLPDMLDIIWVCLENTRGQNPIWKVLIPTRSDLDELMIPLYHQAEFADGFLDLLANPNGPPSIKDLKALPPLVITKNHFGVYIVIMEKAGHRARVYVGQSCSLNGGLPARMRCYQIGDDLSTSATPHGVLESWRDGFRITFKTAVMSIHQQLDLLWNVETFVFMSETLFHHALDSYSAGFRAYYHQWLDVWEDVEPEYDGINRRSPLHEGIKKEHDLTPAQTAELVRQRRAKRSAQAKAYNKSRVWVCEEDKCKIMFGDLLPLRRHLRQTGHMGTIKSSFDCEEPGCDKIFYAQSDLNVHVRATGHMGHEKLEFICSEEGCAKGFHRASQLQYHQEKFGHGGVAKVVYKCDNHQCTSLTFSTPYLLGEHMKIWHGPKKKTLKKMRTVPCTWPNCPKMFTENCSRNKHVREVHEGMTKTYKCPEPGCTKVYKATASLDVHLMSVGHGGVEKVEWPCRIKGCPKIFPTEKGRNTHEKLTSHKGKPRYEID